MSHRNFRTGFNPAGRLAGPGQCYTARRANTNQEEYLADTNPLDPNDKLQITFYSRSGTYNRLLWAGKPTRFYRVESSAAPDPSMPWDTIISYDWLGWNNVGFVNSGPQYFYRVRAVKPLSP